MLPYCASTTLRRYDLPFCAPADDEIAMTMTDDLYIAADERARDARRAGLQARKDEQPLNTTRSYASKQREWKARRPSPPLPLLSPLARSLYYIIGPLLTRAL